MSLKKFILIITVVIGYAFLFILILWNLPIEIKRHQDIKFAEIVIIEIEKYEKENGLPNSNDDETLKQLGFEDHIDFLVPEYSRISEDTYELYFIEGFDSPYLIWNSNERVWKMDMPTLSHYSSNPSIID